MAASLAGHRGWVTRRTRPSAKCPIRPGEPCTLCQIDVTGPQDCGLVYLVMNDPELREQINARRRPSESVLVAALA